MHPADLGDVATWESWCGTDTLVRVLQWLARRNQTSVDEVLTRELEDVACAYAEEIASDVAGFEMAMSWPECAASAALK